MSFFVLVIGLALLLCPVSNSYINSTHAPTFPFSIPSDAPKDRHRPERRREIRAYVYPNIYVHQHTDHHIICSGVDDEDMRGWVVHSGVTGSVVGAGAAARSEPAAAAAGQVEISQASLAFAFPQPGSRNGTGANVFCPRRLW